MLTIYVGCALNNATEEFRHRIEVLKGKLRERGHTVLDFIGLVNGTSRDVWNYDMKTCVGGCNFLLAIADHASTGLGIEIGLAIGRYEIPVLIVAQKGLSVTRAVQDPDETDVVFQWYGDLLVDVPDMVEAFIRTTSRLCPSLV